MRSRPCSRSSTRRRRSSASLNLPLGGGRTAGPGGVASAVLEASAQSGRERSKRPAQRFRRLATTVDGAARTAYRALLEADGFDEWFAQVSPIDELGRMRIASRPARTAARISMRPADDSQSLVVLPTSSVMDTGRCDICCCNATAKPCPGQPGSDGEASPFRPHSGRRSHRNNALCKLKRIRCAFKCRFAISDNESLPRNGHCCPARTSLA